MTRFKLATLAVASALALGAQPARADPGTIAIALSTVLSVETAVAVTVALYTYGAYVLTGYAIYGSISARNKAKRAAAAARAAYNAGLQDRNITALSAAPGRRVIYGRADTGGDMVAMFTSDKTSHSMQGFRVGTVTKPDAYKHLIIVWAGHQCQAINDLKIDGIPIGALDGNGWATGDEWKKSDPKPTAYGQLTGDLRSKTLPAGSTIISVTLITGADGSTHTPIANGAGGWSFSGTTLTLPGTVTVGGFAYNPVSTDTWDIAYSSDDIDGTSTVRVRHHLGAPDQTADAELVALLPDQWTVDHRLRGRCYSWVTLDLERPQFQGGPPGITADISGALVLDPRTSTTGWSQNPALCAYDYLLRVEGMGVTSAEVDVASVIAAANECDVSTSFTIGGSTVTGPRYSCNGVFVSGPAKEAVLIDICESMAGFHTYSGVWRVLAGSWTPPVMDLTDEDLFGSISIVQSGEPSGELFNSVRGQYVPAGSSVPADIEPYSNATFVAADRKPLYEDIELPFTNSRARAKNISRIKVEQSRAGLVIFFPAKLRAWPLQTGDRVTVTSAEYGFAAKQFRVTDWQFGLRSPVGLTLQEDAAEIYDLADAATADPTPNTGLPNGRFVEPVGSPNVYSGTAQLQRLGDGTVISRVLLTWTSSPAAYMQGGRIEAVWREAGSTVEHLVYADSAETQMYLTGVRDGAQIIIELTAINSLGCRSAPWAIGHKVIGKSQPPSNVAGLAASVIQGAVRITWTQCTDADYDFTILRYGASWAAGTTLPFNRPGNGYDWLWPAPGSYTIWAVNVDTTGNWSTPVATTVTVDSSIYIGASNLSGIPYGTINADPGLLNPSSAWAWDSGITVQGPSTATGALGIKYFSGGATPDQFAWSKQYFPISAAQTYNLSALIYGSVTNNRYMFLVVDMYKADGNRITGADTGWGGTFAGYAYSGVPSAGSFSRNGADFGAGTSRPIPAAAAYFRVGVWFQYSGSGSSSNQQAAEDIRLIDVTDARTAYALADAQSTVALINDGGMTIVGNTATKTGGSSGAWDGSIRSRDSFSGGAFASWVIVDTTRSLGLGLNTDPTTNTSYNTIDAWMYNSGTELYVYNNGTIQNSGVKVGDVANGDVLAVVYDGSTMRYLRNGAVLFSQSMTITTPLFLDSSFLHIGGLVKNIQFGPLTSNAWSSIGGSGKPLDNAGQVLDTRDVNGAPATYAVGNFREFKRTAVIGITTSSTYCILETIKGWHDGTGGEATQWAYVTSGEIWKRSAAGDAGSWGSWVRDLDRALYTGDLNATQNQVFYTDTDPGAVPNGSIWISSTKAWQRVSGAWQPYVGNGSIDTGQLTGNAATDVTEFTFANWSWSNIA